MSISACPFCLTAGYRTWRTLLWHLVLDHQDSVRRIWDDRYGLHVTDPEDAAVANLTEDQCREVIAATTGLRPGIGPNLAIDGRAPRPHDAMCVRCLRPRVLTARRLCGTCYGAVSRAQELAQWPTAADLRAAS